MRARPDALRDLDGNAARRPRRRTARPSASTGELPHWLRGNEQAQQLWRQLAPGRMTLGLLREGDELLFAALCSEAAVYWRCMRSIVRKGVTQELKGQGNVKRPEVDLRRTALDHVIKIAAAFGMTPADRARIVVPLGADAAVAKRGESSGDTKSEAQQQHGERKPVESIDELLKRRVERRARRSA